MWHYETQAQRQGFQVIAGTDEAGRGPLAGPVVSAAVVLGQDFPDMGLADSKKLSPAARDRLYDLLYDQALAIGIGIIDALEIDRINILQAALQSMAQAVANLRPQPDFILIDGPFPIPASHAQLPIPKGDSLSRSIAAASIVAKVTRDRLMTRYHLDYPEFGFDRHKGYPTAAHRAALQRCGACPIHRRSFRGVEAVSAPP